MSKLHASALRRRSGVKPCKQQRRIAESRCPTAATPPPRRAEMRSVYVLAALRKVYRRTTSDHGVEGRITLMDSTRQQTVHGPRRWLSIVLGLFFVGLAAAGVLLPVLPTTPFLILASACFVRSSPRLNAWLLRSRLFGPMLRQWQEHRRVQRRVKYAAAGVLLLAVSLSAWIGQLSWPWMTLLVALALIGLVVVLRLPEMPDPALATVPVGDAASVAVSDESTQQTLLSQSPVHDSEERAQSVAAIPRG